MIRWTIVKIRFGDMKFRYYDTFKNGCQVLINANKVYGIPYVILLLIHTHVIHIIRIGKGGLLVSWSNSHVIGVL